MIGWGGGRLGGTEKKSVYNVFFVYIGSRTVLLT
jgi:hypothetical protein